MSEFSDGKVLRAPSKILLRILKHNIEGGSTPQRDYRKLDQVCSKLEEALGEYATRDDAARYESQSSIGKGASAEAANNAYQLILAALDERYGAESAPPVFLDLAQYEFLKAKWAANENLIGTKFMRERLLAITDMIENAKGFKLLADNKPWIEGEPKPSEQEYSTSPNGEILDNVRQLAAEAFAKA